MCLRVQYHLGGDHELKNYTLRTQLCYLVGQVKEEWGACQGSLLSPLQMKNGVGPRVLGPTMSEGPITLVCHR